MTIARDVLAVIGALAIAGILTEYMTTDVHGVLLFVIAQGVWNLAVAVQLIRGMV